MNRNSLIRPYVKQVTYKYTNWPYFAINSFHYWIVAFFRGNENSTEYIPHTVRVDFSAQL